MPTKRINSTSGSIFKRGDLSPDGKKVFGAYRAFVKKNGDFAEVWYSPAQYKEVVQKVALNQKKFTSENRVLSLPKRLNPLTGEKYKSGERNDRGQYFIRYVSGQRTSSGHYGEAWGSKRAYLRVRVDNTFQKIKKRARENGIPSSLTVDYLVSILPDDMICPILEKKMEFGGGKDRSLSPSVDRLIPKKGYVKGNVSWVSLLANLVKNERTSTELRMIADWIERQEIYKEHG